MSIDIEIKIKEKSMIRQLGNTFVLDTKNTTYCFRIIETGHLEHLYYGERIYLENETDADVLL